MAKDHIRDYCVAAFQFYARWGGRDNYVRVLVDRLQRQRGSGVCSPTESELVRKELVIREHMAEVADLEAVENVLKICDPDISKTVEMVYFKEPWLELERGDIIKRVHHAETKLPASERQIYNWLRKARNMFAEERGLRVNSKSVQ